MHVHMFICRCVWVCRCVCVSTRVRKRFCAYFAVVNIISTGCCLPDTFAAIIAECVIKQLSRTSQINDSSNQPLWQEQVLRSISMFAQSSICVLCACVYVYMPVVVLNNLCNDVIFFFSLLIILFKYLLF